MSASVRDLGPALAELIERRTGVADPAMAQAVGLLAREIELGQVCANLAEFAGRRIDPDDPDSPTAPTLDAWCERLRRHPAVGAPGDARPMVLDHTGRVYLHRYWAYENAVARDLRARAAAGRVEIVTGGPGTGKTTRVAKILVAARCAGATRIALAAPTGKAAARVGEALVAALERMNVDDATRRELPAQAVTVHRLLGARPGRAAVHRGLANPLDVDVLVVDEASMVGLALLAKILSAVPPEARVVLLGDRDQLASVDPGAVFADLCEPGTVLDGAITVLARSYRYDQTGGIGALASAVRERRADDAIELLRAGGEQLVWAETGDAAALAGPVERAASGDRRVLCAVRDGPFGVAALNERFERGARPSGEGVWYPGRPVIVVRNDPSLGLFNGDLGVVERAADGSLRVMFPAAGRERRAFAPARLPAHETAYAMTVHKSQGSEFNRVTVVLPPEPSPVATRELLYTAITRAREHVEVVATERALRAAIATATRRVSGLRDALAGPHSSA